MRTRRPLRPIRALQRQSRVRGRYSRPPTTTSLLRASPWSQRNSVEEMTSPPNGSDGITACGNEPVASTTMRSPDTLHRRVRRFDPRRSCRRGTSAVASDDHRHCRLSSAGPATPPVQAAHDPRPSRRPCVAKSSAACTDAQCRDACRFALAECAAVSNASRGVDQAPWKGCTPPFRQVPPTAARFDQ